jgi:hypothetical protein
MTDAELTAQLEAVRKQSYPITLTESDGAALVECIRRVMAAVPEDERPFVRADYDLSTSAVCHPEPDEFGNTNERRGHSPSQQP